MSNQFFSALQLTEIKPPHFWFTEDKDSKTEIFTKKTHLKNCHLYSKGVLDINQK